MKHAKQAARSLLLAALSCALLTVFAFAAGDGSVWVTLSETSDGTAALIVTDATVTDGVVELTYDSSALTYQGVETVEAYVAMYSVNAEEEGVVRISWVAPGAYDAVADGAALIQVNFSGTAADGVTLSGSASGADGESVPVVTPTDTPDVPDTPDTPDVPENPDTPDVPENPDTPDVPENPDTPEEPGTSGTEGGKTGDSSMVGAAIGLAVCAAAAAGAAFAVNKRRGTR